MRPTRAYELACLVCLAGLAVAVGIHPLTNNDIWLHLTTGRLILEQGIPHMDPYSFTRAGEPYVAHEWLAQVLFWMIFRAAGVDGLILVKPLALLVTALLLWRASLAQGAGPVAALWGSVLAIAAMTSHLFVRPHLFTFMMLAATSLLLVRVRAADRKSLWILTALQLLWANLHGGFILGPALALTAGSFAAAGLGALASVANPYGPGLFRFVLVFSEPVFRKRIREWASPFEEPFFGSLHFWIYLAFLALTVIAVIHHARRRRWAAVGPLLLFALLSLTSKRNVSLLGIVAAPWLALAATDLSERGAGWAWRLTRARATAISCVAIATLSVVAGLFGVPHETGRLRKVGFGLGGNVPVAALDYATRTGLSGNVLNSLGFGAYITWRSWPATRVFIDSRLDVYGGPFLELYSLAMADPGRMKDLLRSYRFDYAVISYRLEEAAGAVSALSADPDWALVHYDDIALVYLRREPRWADVIRQDAYRFTNPAVFLSGNLSWDHPADSLAETRRALTRSPGSPLILLMQATALTALGRHREAIASLEQAAGRLDAEAGGREILLGMLGTSYMALREDGRAEQTFEELLRASPGSAYARQMLQEIRARRGRPE